MKRPTTTILFTLTSAMSGACLFVPGVDAASGFSPEALQTAFGQANDLKLIMSVAGIPEDGQQKLQTLFRQQAASPTTIPLAEIGMDWSSSDAKIPNLPWGQHRFTAVSDSLIAIVFVTGGSDIRYNVILAPRHSPDFCLFNIPSLHESNLRLSVVQDYLRPDRDQTISSTPKCVMVRGGNDD
ncbi:hypothetical protein [Peristeroidobacter agariperforans]|uniref:hypothetical protein n=1 Tax=Peristeroidobacter agariperforans TaxID=268404 RepID=UPI00101E1AFB|nr:hypothetical protein [Peristeroidobacter agariperforans]